MSDRKDLNLIQKLAKIRAMSDVVARNKEGHNYTYADITVILANITAGMKKYGVSLIPSIKPETANVTQNVTVNTKVDKAGHVYDKTTTEMLVTADMMFTWVNDDDPEEVIKVPWFVTGSQSDPSQAFGSGLTYCTRYFLTSYFEIAQAQAPSDVDAYRSRQKEAEISEEKAIAGEIVSKLDGEVKKYLADNPDESDNIKKLISKYRKDSNYFAIKDPELAAKLLEEFENTYMSREEK